MTQPFENGYLDKYFVVLKVISDCCMFSFALGMYYFVTLLDLIQYSSRQSSRHNNTWIYLAFPKSNCPVVVPHC